MANKPLRYWWWLLRNPWCWPGIYQLGCWWEKRYRPERWQESHGSVRREGPEAQEARE